MISPKVNEIWKLTSDCVIILNQAWNTTIDVDKVLIVEERDIFNFVIVELYNSKHMHKHFQFKLQAIEKHFERNITVEDKLQDFLEIL